jgi:DNA repair protein SbcD/Mre11
MDENADALLCGGDLYEHERFTPDTGEFLRSTFEPLYPTPVYIAPGNHDWYGENSLYRRTSWPPNVRVFEQARLRPITLTDGLTLWGAAHRAPANTDNFLTRFHVDRAGIHIALFHGSERAWFLEQEQGKLPHAAFEAAEIERSGLHHALLGHFHTPKHAELFTYPGNPDPLTFGEKGERGAVVATVYPDGTLHRVTHRVAVTQAHEVEVDVTGSSSQQDVREAIASVLRGLTGVARVTLTGELRAEVELGLQDLDNMATQLDALMVREGELRVAYDLDAIGQEPTVRGRFVREVEQSGLDPEEKRKVLLTGLRALDDRSDLEVP